MDPKNVSRCHCASLWRSFSVTATSCPRALRDVGAPLQVVQLRARETQGHRGMNTKEGSLCHCASVATLLCGCDFVPPRALRDVGRAVEWILKEGSLCHC